MPPTDDLAAWIAAAQTRHLAIELAGVFWVAAELGILFLILWGREHLHRSPESATLSLTPHTRRQFIAITLVTLALLALVLLRASLKATAPITNTIAIADEVTHLRIWAGFVTLWVVLECAIVYHGTRGYNDLRRLLGTRITASRMPAAALALLLALGTAAFAHAQLTAVEENLIPVQNELYFYLRVAGIVWIAVEWFAAYILLRTFTLLRPYGVAR